MADKTNAKRLTDSELSVFCTQIAMLLRSGISVTEGLSIMVEDSENTEGRAILKTALDHCELGEPLSSGLRASGAFPEYLLNMTAIGEESGRLDEVMDALSSYYEREDALHEAVRSAVRYPLVMIVMMAVVMGVLMTRVLPVFNEVFLQLGTELSGVSLSILRAGQALSRYSVLLVVLAAVVAAALLWLNKTAAGRAFRLKYFSSRVLGSRRLADKIGSARFASGMSLMLSSGLDTDKSLEMVSRLVDSPLVRKKIAHCQELIGEGQNFADALVNAGLFTGVYARMVTVGYKTGSADAVMKNLADRYQEEIDTQVSRTVSLIEPTLVAVFSVLVGFILLSVMLPLMGIMSSIG